MNLGELIAGLGLDMADMQRKLAIAQGDLSRFAKESVTELDKVEKGWGSISGAINKVQQHWKAVLGILGAGAGLTLLVRNVARTGDELSKMSERLGIATETLSAYRLSADLANISLEGFGVGMRTLSRNMFDISKGTGEAKEAFKTLGISVVDSNGKLRSNEAVMLEVADAFKQMESGTLKTALAQEIFGRSGLQMIPLLNEGAEGLKRQKEEAKGLGAIWSTVAAKDAEAFNDSITRLRFGLMGIASAIIKDVLPPLTTFITMTTDGVKWVLQAGSAVKEFNASLKGTPETIQETVAVIRTLNDELVVTVERTKDTQAWWKKALDVWTWLVIPFRKPGFLEDLNEGKRLTQELTEEMQKMKQVAITRSLTELPIKTQVQAQKELNKEIQQQRNIISDVVRQERELAEIRQETNLMKRHDTIVRDANEIGQAFKQTIELDIQDKLLQTGEIAKNQFDAMEQFAIQGARGMQSAFQEFFFDAFTGETKTLSETLNSLWRLAAGVLSNVAATGLTSMIGGRLNIPGFAHGGAISGPAIVGERGPELFIPRGTGTIVPNNKLGGGFGGITVNQVLNISPGVPEAVRREIVSLMPELNRQAIGAIRGEINRGGNLARDVGRRR